VFNRVCAKLRDALGNVRIGLPGSKLVPRADYLRDRGRFKEAAEVYSRHLSLCPSDFAIWIQAGNCLKEAALYEASLSCYEKAIALNDDDADAYLQKGHLLKLMGQAEAALASYERSLKSDPGQLDALREIVALEKERSIGTLRDPKKAEKDRDSHNLYLDISDLLAFLRHHSTVTGIQRVISNIVSELSVSQEQWSHRQFCFVFVDRDSLTVRQVEPAAIQRLLSIIEGKHPERIVVDMAIDAIIASGREIWPREDDIYFILGAFWLSPAYERIIVGLKEVGVKVGVYVFDMIPITHREFVTAQTASDFRARIFEILQLCDFVLTISEYVSQEVRKFVGARLLRTIPVGTVPLGHELKPSIASKGQIGAEVREVAESDFVLCVCTIEKRKNHQLLLDLWRDLVATEGDAVPTLVLVGKWGWKVENLRKQLEESSYLRGKIKVLSTIADTELAYLYQRCLFSIYPSFAEGWGLPVGESLANGKPCLASHATSIPEVGGELAVYFDPYDVWSAHREVINLLHNRSELEAWGKRIREGFQVRTWAQVAVNLVQSIEQFAATIQSSKNRAYVDIPPGLIATIGRSATTGSEQNTELISRTALLARVKNWDLIEEGGSWAHSEACVLRFGVDAGVGSYVEVALKLQIARELETMAIRVTSGQATAVITRLAIHPRWVFTTCQVSEGNVVEMTLSGDWSDPRQEPYCGHFVKLYSYGYYIKGDIEQRLDFLQSIIGEG
jgi:glycosyltransferase involved in cell wall biosynthesis